MTAPAPIPVALDIVEDAVLAALNALAPTNSAYWGAAPVDTVGRLSQPPAQAAHLSRVYVAQHQDGGGQEAALLGSRGWRGLVTVRVLSADLARAKAGFALVVDAMSALTSPDGYALRVEWVRPLDLPTINRIVARAGMWELTLRRVP